MNSLCDVVPVRGGRSSTRIRGRSTACLAEVVLGWSQGLDDSEPPPPSAPRGGGLIFQSSSLHALYYIQKNTRKCNHDLHDNGISKFKPNRKESHQKRYNNPKNKAVYLACITQFRRHIFSIYVPENVIRKLNIYPLRHKEKKVQIAHRE